MNIVCRNLVCKYKNYRIFDKRYEIMNNNITYFICEKCKNIIY